MDNEIPRGADGEGLQVGPLCGLANVDQIFLVWAGLAAGDPFPLVSDAWRQARWIGLLAGRAGPGRTRLGGRRMCASDSWLSSRLRGRHRS